MDVDEKVLTFQIVPFSVSAKKNPTVYTFFMRNQNKLFLILFTALLVMPLSIFAQNKITIKGKVIDAKTQETLPFASVFFQGTNVGTETDFDGNFDWTTRRASDTLAAAFIGYETKLIVLPTGVAEHTINFELTEAGGFDLGEVVVQAKKTRYKRKGNPSWQLWRNVVKNADKNRPQNYDFYEYDKYEKVELDINNLTDKFRKRKALKQFQFLFDYADTSDLNGKTYLPIFIQEAASKVYYRKSPETTKEYRSGVKVSGLDDYMNEEDFTVVTDFLYRNIDIYEQSIQIFDKQFPSPIGGLIADRTYQFGIIDTLTYNGHKVIDLSFYPANKDSRAFKGHLYVKADSTYAVIKAEFSVDKRADINFVNELLFSQEFEQVEKAWVLDKDDIIIDFAPRKKGLGFLAKRSVLYDNHLYNTEREGDIYSGTENVIDADDLYEKDKAFWAEVRQEELSASEENIYEMIDTLQKVPTFRTVANIGRLLFSGYQPVGPFDIGPIGAFYSFNEVEGFRLRFGGQTNLKFHPKIRLEGYGVYGFKDKRWKYSGGIMYSFKDNFEENPRHFIRLAYQHETNFVGEPLEFVAENNFFLSFKRGDISRMLFLDSYLAEHFLEFDNNLSFRTYFNYTERNPIGNFEFNYFDEELGEPSTFSRVTTSEVGMKIRFAPNEQYIQGRNYRIPIYNKYPTLEFFYEGGFKDLGSDYEYHRFRARIFKRFFLSVFGVTRLEAEAGRIFADGAPYFLLHLPQANQTFAYKTGFFNLMNFMEFASDKWAIINLEHSFEGFFFNKIPLLERLKLREVVTFRAIYGGLDDKNNPNINPGLIQFLETNDGEKITYTLEDKPYMEAGIGVQNIFKLFRVDLVQRLNYLNHPNVPQMFEVPGLAIRIGAKVQF